MHPGVYAPVAFSTAPVQRLSAARLAGGPAAFVSHRGAAWLWGLLDVPEVEITVPLGKGTMLDGVVVHRSGNASGTASRRRLPATNPLRTMVELGAVAPLADVELALDRGVALRLFTPGAVAAELERRGGRGRRGVGKVRAVLHERGAISTRSPSVLQGRMARLLARSGLPAPEPEHEVLDGRYRVDFAWPERRVAVEVDGYEHHSSWDDFRHDRQRQNDLVLGGWVVLRFTWDDVCRRPGGVAAGVSRALAASRPA